MCFHCFLDVVDGKLHVTWETNRIVLWNVDFGRTRFDLEETTRLGGDSPIDRRNDAARGSLRAMESFYRQNSLPFSQSFRNTRLRHSVLGRQGARAIRWQI